MNSSSNPNPKPRFNATIRADLDRILSEESGLLAGLAGTTLLVTGTNGLLCSYFVDTVAALNDAGLEPRCRVVAVDNLVVGTSERLRHLEGRDDVRFLQHDATQPLALDRVDWIIHGASIASPVFYRKHPLETIDVNVTGTRRMLDLARERGARGMLYLSTSEIYGDPDPAHVPTSEEYRGNVSCTGPRACYDESKRLAETLCVTYHALYGAPAKIIRPFNVFGPGQRLDDGRIIPDLMKAALFRDPIVLFSDGRATRSFCYVSDAVRAMWRVLLAGAPGSIFNVGNDEIEISIRDLAACMRDVAGPPELEIVHRTSEDRNYLTDNPQRRCPDLTKLRTELGWEPRVGLAEGLQRTLQSYRE